MLLPHTTWPSCGTEFRDSPTVYILVLGYKNDRKYWVPRERQFLLAMLALLIIIKTQFVIVVISVAISGTSIYHRFKIISMVFTCTSKYCTIY